MAVRFNVADITRFRMDGEIMKVTAIARHPGVLQYRDGTGVRGELVTPFFLRKLDSEGLPIIRKIAGIPVTNEHPSFLFKYRADAVDELKKGEVGPKIHVFKDGATETTFETWDSDLQNGIRSGEKKGVSLGYEVGTVPVQGNWDGMPYQFEQSEPFYADHLAVVANPRARGALIKRFDSEDDWACQVCTDSGVWDLERRNSLQSGAMHGAFAGQDLSFPIASKADVADAWLSSFRTDSEDQVRSNILAIAKEYGWQDGLPSSAIAWAQERDIPLKSRTTTQKRKTMATVNFDGGVTLEIPNEAIGPITALKSRADAQAAELAKFRADAAELKAKADADAAELATLRADMDAMKKKKMEEDEEMQETYDSYVFEKARADALEAEAQNRADSDDVSTEVASRIDAYMDAVGILAPNLKQALDALEINFDGKQSVTDIQKATLAHLRPDLKLDEDEISGAYKLAKMDAKPATERDDSSTVFNIVRKAVTQNVDSTDKHQRRLARMDAERKRSLMTFDEQAAFDRQQAIAQ